MKEEFGGKAVDETGVGLDVQRHYSPMKY